MTYHINCTGAGAGTHFSGVASRLTVLVPVRHSLYILLLQASSKECQGIFCFGFYTVMLMCMRVCASVHLITACISTCRCDESLCST